MLKPSKVKKYMKVPDNLTFDGFRSFIRNCAEDLKISEEDALALAQCSSFKDSTLALLEIMEKYENS